MMLRWSWMGHEIQLLNNSSLRLPQALRGVRNLLNTHTYIYNIHYNIYILLIYDLQAHRGWVLDFAWMCIPATVSKITCYYPVPTHLTGTIQMIPSERAGRSIGHDLMWTLEIKSWLNKWLFVNEIKPTWWISKWLNKWLLNQCQTQMNKHWLIRWRVITMLLYIISHQKVQQDTCHDFRTPILR